MAIEPPRRLLLSLRQALERGDNTLVWAGPRMGGSQLVSALADDLRRQWHARPNQPRWVPLSIDAQALPTAPLAAARALWQQILSCVLDPHVQAPAAPPRPPKIVWLGQKDAFEQLQAACIALWAGLLNTPGWCRLLLLVDHGDALQAAAAHALCQGLGRWIGMSEGSPHGVVVVGGLDLMATPPPAWQTWSRQILPVPRDADAAAWCRRQGISDADLWLAVSGKHPFVLTALIEAAARQNSGHSLTPAVQAEALAVCAPLFEEIYTALMKVDPDAQRRLAQILDELQGGVAPVPIRALEAVCDHQPVHAWVMRLEAAGLCERLVAGPSEVVRAGCGLFNAWCQNR